MDYYIAGIDPGTTIGFALLDLNGNLVTVDSFKGTIDDVFSLASYYGKIIIIGTDVSNVSKTIEKFASRIGALVVSPDYDLMHYEKRKKTKEFLKLHNYKLKDKHQMDALAAALIAYRHFSSLFNKIHNELSDKELTYAIKKEILLNNTSIKRARQRIESQINTL